MPPSIIDVDPDGELIIHLGHDPESENAATKADATSDSPVQLRVSMKHVLFACHRAKAVFKGGFKEFKPEADGAYHWRLGSFFNSEAVKTVMNVIHGHTRQVPLHVSLPMLVAISAVTDDLLCHSALWFFAKSWILALCEQSPSPLPKDPTWMFISFVFHEHEIFRYETRKIIESSTGGFDTVKLRIPPSVLDAAETQRLKLLGSLMSRIQSVIDDLCRGKPPSGCPYTESGNSCSSVLLGSLTQQLLSAGLHPAPPKPFKGRALSSTIQAVRSFESPVIFLPALEPVQRQQVWNRKRDQYDRSPRAESDALIKHHCSLKALLKTELDAVEAEIKGLNLSHYTACDSGCVSSVYLCE